MSEIVQPGEITIPHYEIDFDALNTVKEVRKAIVAVAAGEIGVVEDAGPNVDKNGRIQGYWNAVTDEVVDRWLGYIPGTKRPDKAGGNDWCAAFACWVMDALGFPLDHDHGSGYYGCNRIIEWATRRGGWRSVTQAYTPRAGDLVMFDWDRLHARIKEDGNITPKMAAKNVDHVGIVEKFEAGVIHTIEGNWRSGVNRARRPLHRKNILGCCIVITEDDL